MTKYAKKICAIIHETSAHMSAEQIFLELKKTDPKVVLATVYNNLNILCREGIIRRLSVEGSPDPYDRTVRHDHLVCKACGKLADICLEDLTENLETQLGEGILSYDLKVFYLCPACRHKHKAAEDNSF